MTVKELKELLENIPGDILVCCNGIGGKYLITNSGIVGVDSEDEDFFVSDDVLVLYTEGK